MGVLIGQSGTLYELSNRISSGTEGEIYEIKGMPKVLAKIYKAETLSGRGPSSIRSKIEYMCLNPIQRIERGVRPVFAWPLEPLFSNGRFAGCVIPKIGGMESIISAYTQPFQESLFPRYTWRYAASIARNLAAATAFLHAQNVIKGDWNPKDILVDGSCILAFVDCDSFDLSLRASGKYKCAVVWPDTLAPELQGKDPTSAKFTKESDCFALAVLVFQLLMEGFHPFGAPLEGSSNPTPDNIAKGRCAFVDGSIPTPPGAPDPRILPEDIMSLFFRCFSCTIGDVTTGRAARIRPTAVEWAAALDRLVARLSSDSERCASGHVHLPAPWLKGKQGGCPFCEQKARSERHLRSMARIRLSVKPPTVSGARSGGTASSNGNAVSAKPSQGMSIQPSQPSATSPPPYSPYQPATLMKAQPDEPATPLQNGGILMEPEGLWGRIESWAASAKQRALSLWQRILQELM